MITLVVSLSDCKSAPSAVKPPKPINPKELHITWQEESNGRLSLSREDAVKLAQWLIDVEYYLDF